MLFHRPDLRPAGTGVQAGGELIQLVSGSHCKCFDRAVILVANPPCYVQGAGAGFDKGTETDALHLARDYPSARGQDAGSPLVTGSAAGAASAA